MHSYSFSAVNLVFKKKVNITILYISHIYCMFVSISVKCLFSFLCCNVLCAGESKPPMVGPPSGEFDGASSRPQDPSNPSAPSDIPPNKPAWYDPQHMGPWNPNQPVKTYFFCFFCCVIIVMSCIALV